MNTTAVEVNYESYDADGVAVTIDEFLTNQEFTTAIQTDVINESGDDRHGVQFNYEHVYSYFSGVVDILAILPDEIELLLPDDASSWNDDVFTTLDD
ncbi:hypothetical protein [Halostagnicola bangensis]